MTKIKVKINLQVAGMNMFCRRIITLLVVTVFAACTRVPGGTTAGGGTVLNKTGAQFFNVDLNASMEPGAPVNFAGGDSLANELQWLTVHIACIGIYNMAQTGDYTLGDPTDYYTPGDIREFLTERSGEETKTDMFYGICFNYAQAAYDDITQNPAFYQPLGVKEWYIAAVFENPGEIVLTDPAAPEEADGIINGVPVKAVSVENVRTHGGATMHAWLWVLGNDGEIYWIDPTWTDNTGYPWWGVVRNGEELQLNPLESLCKEEANPSSEAFAWNNNGNAYYHRGDYDTAIAAFNEALRINPNYAMAYFNRGNTYVGKGDDYKAIEDFTEALRIDPYYSEAYNNRGNSYNDKGEYDRAIADFTAALRINPYYSEAYNNRGFVYYNRGEYDRAIADYAEALRINPNMALAYNNRGVVYDDRGEYDRAIVDFNEALRIDPNMAKAYNNRGNMYNNQGEYDRAIVDLNAALRIDPNMAAAYNNRGNAYDGRGDYDRAIDDYNSALWINPNYAAAYYNRGITYYRKNEYDKAIADYNEALRINPNLALAYYNRGFVYYYKGDLDRAIAEWETVLRIDPNHAGAKNNLELARKKRGF